jgi:hypothetical protein
MGVGYFENLYYCGCYGKIAIALDHLSVLFWCPALPPTGRIIEELELGAYIVSRITWERHTME